MKLKFLRVAVPLAAAAFMVPAGVAADCLVGSYRLNAQFFDEGDRTVGASLNAGDGQTVFGGDVQLALNDAWSGGFAVGICRGGGESAIVFGGRAAVEAYMSEEGWAVQVGMALMTVSFNGNRTTTVPVAVYLLYPINEQTSVVGGVSLQFQRFSNDVFSASNENFGLQGGLEHRLSDELSLAGGLDMQFYTGSTQVGFVARANYAIQE